MELSIACLGKTSHVFDTKKEDRQFIELLDYTTNDSMAVTTTSMKVSGTEKFKDTVAHQQKREGEKSISLKELQAKEYPFPDSDLLAILDELLTKRVIELLE